MDDDINKNGVFMDKITGPNSGKMLLGEYVISLSEIEKKRFRIEKMLKNWKTICLVSILAYTLKIAAEQLVMLIR